jgi:hypothetical protein
MFVAKLALAILELVMLRPVLSRTSIVARSPGHGTDLGARRALTTALTATLTTASFEARLGAAARVRSPQSAGVGAGGSYPRPSGPD